MDRRTGSGENRRRRTPRGSMARSRRRESRRSHQPRALRALRSESRSFWPGSSRTLKPCAAGGRRAAVESSGWPAGDHRRVPPAEKRRRSRSIRSGARPLRRAGPEPRRTRGRKPRRARSRRPPQRVPQSPPRSRAPQRENAPTRVRRFPRTARCSATRARPNPRAPCAGPVPARAGPRRPVSRSSRLPWVQPPRSRRPAAR